MGLSEQPPAWQSARHTDPVLKHVSLGPHAVSVLISHTLNVPPLGDPSCPAV